MVEGLGRAPAPVFVALELRGPRYFFDCTHEAGGELGMQTGKDFGPRKYPCIHLDR